MSSFERLTPREAADAGETNPNAIPCGTCGHRRGIHAQGFAACAVHGCRCQYATVANSSPAVKYWRKRAETRSVGCRVAGCTIQGDHDHNLLADVFSVPAVGR